MNFNEPNQADYMRHEIVDHQQQGIVAAVFAHPRDWRAQSQVYWNYQYSTLPAVFQARAANAENTAVIEFLPMETFSWTEPQTGFFGVGQNMGGTVNMPPMPAVDALVQLIVPKYRGNRQDLRLTGANAEPTPVNPPPPVQSAAGHKVRVRIEYAENGRAITEEFHATHIVSRFPPMSNGFGMSYFTPWSLTELCCFRAAREDFDRLRETFLKIQASMKISAQWIELANKVSQMLVRNEGQIGDGLIEQGWANLSANQQRIDENAARGWEYIRRQDERIKNSYNTPPPSMQSDPYKSGSSDSSYTQQNAFIDSIREERTIDNPENPANNKVSVHYDNYWKDDFGNTFGTNDPNYDPNRDSNRNWTPAKIKRTGD